ncbi:LLM class F420-dependent oxidoreductase [Mycolicibacterium hodleri]|uniref:LLM class F420-dependent oxidoreductase n=1 Tax=Mycolicibacterium hodleri TaxID=49897 RepID=A0A502EDH8_9MYCO|nr:LLM class F420-dependent oxidoreductase [Mycolicibacterium hodleri]TPG35059.1 LLM class F420-dependent oxidoreductase [Mycolicibacterium hodleri]
MKIGISTFLTDQGITPTALATALEDRGFDSLLVAEHTHIPISRVSPSPEGGELPEKYYHVLDPFVALTAAATVTSRLLVGTGVILLSQRDPIITAKEVASLDVLSGGRFILGVGIGWNREEMTGHGTDPRTRGPISDERLSAMEAIWAEDIAEYHGRFVDFEPMSTWPKPVHGPRPPLYVGGSPAAFHRIDRFKAGWYAFAASAADVTADAARLRELTGVHTPVTVAHVGPVTPEELTGYAEGGIERVAIQLPTLPESATLRELDDYIAVAAASVGV